MPPLKTVKNVNIVSLMLHENGTYYLGVWNPALSKMEICSCRTKSRTDALRQAKDRDEALRRGYERLRGDRLEVAEGLAFGIRQSPANDETKRALKARAKYFLDWLCDAHPRLTYFDQLRPSHVREYAVFHLERGLKGKSVRDYLEVVQLSARFLSLEDPDHYHPLTIRHPELKSRRPEKRYLSRKELETVIEVARQHRDEYGFENALTGFILGGFAGLNLREIARLTREAFDFEAGTLTISLALSMRLKTEYRERTIPVAPVVLDYVRDLFARREAAGDANPNLVVRRDGSQGGNDILAKPMREVVRRCWHEVKGDGFSARPKDVRKTFDNLALAAGVPEEWRKAYLGHAPTATIGRHYSDYQNTTLLRREVLDRVFPSTGKNLGKARSGEALKSLKINGKEMVATSGLEPLT